LDRSGAINVFDLLCTLDVLGGKPSSCGAPASDIAPCGGDGQVNIFDLLSILDALSGIDPCCSNGIGACCLGDGSCTGVNSVIECTGQGGTIMGQTTTCFDDRDADGLLDIMETNTGVLNLPCDAGTDPDNPDTDGDGILDGDEVMITPSGLDLAAMGANPFRKDIFVEIDWSKFGSVVHRPSAAAVALVEAAFANAPVSNPNGTTGITLHVDFGQSGLFMGGNQISGDWEFIAAAALPSFKSANFDPAREGFFHYILATQRIDTPINNISGASELGGDDSMTALQAFNTTDNDARTIMRMLGHNLGLRSGGDDDIDFKPNYNSIVNSRFQFAGVDTTCDAIGDGVLDFSDGSRITLDETSLNEFAGVCGNVAINWDGFALSSGVARNINCAAGSTIPCGGTNPQCFDATCDVLNDFNDWASLVYTMQVGGTPTLILGAPIPGS